MARTSWHLWRWLDRLLPLEQNPPYVRPPQGAWRYILSSIGQMRSVAAAMLVTAVLYGTTDALLPVLLGLTIDTYILPSAEGPRLSTAAFATLAVLALAARPLLFFVEGMMTYFVFGTCFEPLLTRQAHRHVLGQSYNFFQNEFAGRIANKVSGLGRATREVVGDLLEAVSYVFAYLLVALTILTAISPWLMVPLGLWMLAYVCGISWLVPRLQARNKLAFRAQSEVQGRIVDAYTNIQTVQLFGDAEEEDGFVLEAMRQSRDRSRAVNLLLYLADLGLELLNTAMIVGLFTVSLWFWNLGLVSAGAIAIALPIGFKVMAMSNWVMRMATSIFSALGTVQEALDTVALEPDMQDAPDASPLAVRQGRIAFEQVSFSYGAKTAVVEDLSFVIEPGEKIALVGPSGAGKSTLTALLLRLYDLNGGRILIDGQDIAQVTRQSLRAQIALVTQDTSLLHRSVAENIAYGRPGVLEAEIEHAAQRASAADFIAELSDPEGRSGYQARVGERGVKLSGGQRQRVALARVLLKDAPIVVFDEATSALDSETEAELQAQLELVSQNKTVITIAHRLATIQQADRVFVMEAGKIVQVGSHAALLAEPGLYAQLWQRQAGGFLGAVEGEERAQPGKV